MNWGIIAQATFFLAISLLAIVIMIFVFASSLLGRAVEAHHNEQKKLQSEKEATVRLRKQEWQQKLEQSTSREEIARLGKEVTALEKEISEFEKKMKNIDSSYGVFRVKGGLTDPALSFLVSSAFSGVAWGLAQSELIQWLGFWSVPSTLFWWSLAVVGIGFGIYKLYYSLRKIEEVAITSEEAALRSQIQAYKTAQKELETEAAPALELRCIKPDSVPIYMQAEEQLTLEYDLRLVKGQMAEHISVFIFVPPGFDFPQIDAGKKRVSGPKDSFPDHLWTFKHYDRLIAGLLQPLQITIKAPRNTGRFAIRYVVNCRGLAQLPGTIDVEVMPKSQSVKPRISKPKG